MNEEVNKSIQNCIKQLNECVTENQKFEVLKNLFCSMNVNRIYANQRLTQRELACLWFAAKGKTSSETAKLLGIKRSTVETYRKKIKQKLSCRNLVQAVFEGLYNKQLFINKFNNFC